MSSADRFLRLLEIADDLIVGAQLRRRRDHHAGGARIHRGARQRAHGGEARRRDADDDLHVFGALDEAPGDLLRLGRLELRRLAQNAEHGDAVAADLGVEVGQPVDGFLVDAAVVVERRRRDREGACGLGGEFCHLCLCSVYPSFRDGRVSGAQPSERRARSGRSIESSGLDAAHSPRNDGDIKIFARPS